MGKIIIGVVAAACFLAGCEAPEDHGQTVRLEKANFQAAFQATQEVLAQDYVVARADAGTGRIETQPKMVTRTGKDRQLGALISSGAAQYYRRTVRCFLTHDASGVEVRVAAALQRESGTQEQVQQAGREGVGSDRMNETPGWQPGAAADIYWVDVGPDAEAERAILKKIEDRVGAEK
jgi:hypothetical protein